ncbi:MAG: helix-turn-helix domain-containing protein [Oscillospiraceae bacterium]|jgi:predicted HTH transcriptional regulator|nr:helix-turn-helix domain-containing protein [Oscillospiraceae bacterium]
MTLKFAGSQIMCFNEWHRLKHIIYNQNISFDFFMHNFYTLYKVIQQRGIELKRIDLIEKTLAKLSTEHGVTAGELAASLGLSRANVSNDLNRLCDESKAEKVGFKPCLLSDIRSRSTAEYGIFSRACLKNGEICTISTKS